MKQEIEGLKNENKSLAFESDRLHKQLASGGSHPSDANR